MDSADADDLMDSLCDDFSFQSSTIDSEEEYELLQQSQCFEIDNITWEFIEKSVKRYRTYLNNINFDMYAQAGLRIKILMEEFIHCEKTNKQLLACKCQVIDKLILELLSWLDSVHTD